MKARMKIVGLLVLSMLGTSAFADASDSKASTRIDFNKMIDDNNSARTVLHKDIDRKAAQAVLNGDSDSERAKVVDFVDVEVGWGETAPVVDRRFDSIGEARPYNMDETALQSKDAEPGS